MPPAIVEVRGLISRFDGFTAAEGGGITGSTCRFSALTRNSSSANSGSRNRASLFSDIVRVFSLADSAAVPFCVSHTIDNSVRAMPHLRQDLLSVLTQDY